MHFTAKPGRDEAAAKTLRNRLSYMILSGRDIPSIWHISGLQAKFDGKDYAVRGSALADTIAYIREGELQISGGKKAGATTLTETATVSGDGKMLTLIFRLQAVSPQAPDSVAVFRKQAERT